jgi:hypothetical protein
MYIHCAEKYLTTIRLGAVMYRTVGTITFVLPCAPRQHLVMKESSHRASRFCRSCAVEFHRETLLRSLFNFGGVLSIIQTLLYLESRLGAPVCTGIE